MVRSSRSLVWFFALLLCLSAARADSLDKALAAYESGDYATALKVLRPLAEQGQPDAQFRLGTMYDNGLGLPRDAARAEYWYNKACPVPEPATDR